MARDSATFDVSHLGHLAHPRLSEWTGAPATARVRKDLWGPNRRWRCGHDVQSALADMGTLCIPKSTYGWFDLGLGFSWDSSWTCKGPAFFSGLLSIEAAWHLETLQTLLCPTVWEPPNHEQLPIFVHGPFFLEQGGASNPISGGTIYWWECWLWFRGHQLRMSARRGGAFTTLHSSMCSPELQRIRVCELVLKYEYSSDISHLGQIPLIDS